MQLGGIIYFSRCADLHNVAIFQNNNSTSHRQCFSFFIIMCNINCRSIKSLMYFPDISVRICTRSFASRFDNGSSIKKTFASLTIALPKTNTLTLCLPPDNAFGLRPRYSVNPNISAASLTFCSISFLLLYVALAQMPYFQIQSYVDIMHSFEIPSQYLILWFNIVHAFPINIKISRCDRL